MVLSVAVRYSGYAASVTRTFLVDPSKSFLRSYLHMVEVNNAVRAPLFASRRQQKPLQWSDVSR